MACKRPLKHLVPYNAHVEWLIPGKALYYSTVKPALGGLGCDPLVVTTVTTTRKIFSVLLSILTKGHSLNPQGWAGIALASAGILVDAFGKRK